MRMEALALRTGQRARARPPCSPTAPIPGWCRTWSSRRCSTSPRTPAWTPARPAVARRVGQARAAPRHQGHPHRRTRHAGGERAEGAQRVRQHLVGRRLRQRGRAAGRTGLGHAREQFPARRQAARLRLRLRDLFESRPARAPGCAPGPRTPGTSTASDHAFRSDFARRLLHGARTARGGLPARPRTTPITRATTRCCRCTSSPAATGMQDRKRIMLDEITDGHRRARRAARRTREERLLVRLAAVHRGGARARALQQRHQPAGHRGGARRHDLGHGESEARHRRAGRHGFPPPARDLHALSWDRWSASTRIGRRCISAASCSPRISTRAIRGSSRTFGWSGNRAHVAAASLGDS